jgi:hypothetical protein
MDILSELRLVSTRGANRGIKVFFDRTVTNESDKESRTEFCYIP